jgi:hypothetical protein
MIRSTVLAATLGLALVSAPAYAATEKFAATLTAAAETPPTTSKGSGVLAATLDTKTLKFSWTVTYKGLTGKATAAHFHGPAAVGAKAAPVVPIVGSLASPIKGSATLTKAQAADLEAGKWYFNVHTAKYPDGELRGQVAKK